MMVIPESPLASVKEGIQNYIGQQLLLKFTWRGLLFFKTYHCTSSDLEHQKDFIFKIFLVFA